MELMLSYTRHNLLDGTNVLEDFLLTLMGMKLCKLSRGIIALANSYILVDLGAGGRICLRTALASLIHDGAGLRRFQ
jgi:hypothetical protein